MKRKSPRDYSSVQSVAFGDSARFADLTKSNARPLRLHLDHTIDSPVRRYGLSQILEVLGAPCYFDATGDADIYYGYDPLAGGRARVWIRPELESDWRANPPSLSMIEGMPVLHHDWPPISLVDRNRIEFDIALSGAYWLTLTSESLESRRDAHGRVGASDCLLGRNDLVERPPLLGYAAFLAKRLWSMGTPTNLIPRWPGGKTWAVALTHDVDRPERQPLGRGLVRELLFPKTISRRKAYYALRAELNSNGYYQSLLAGPARRREWDFEKLRQAERKHGLRSAFYFAVVDRLTGHPCDVAYDANAPHYHRLFRRLAKDGSELGLHAGYASRWGCPPTHQQVSRLRQYARQKAVGVRHHYLQINHDDPMLTLFEHAQAGLRYDTSLGFNDRPGFRAGTALPFAPYHDDHGVAEKFVELPMSLADMHIPARDERAACKMVLHHLQRARDLGGMAVLNWHVGHWHSDPAWRAAYLAACRFIGSDATAWCALPSDIAEWWIARRRTLQTSAAQSGEIRYQRPPTMFEWPPSEEASMEICHDSHMQTVLAGVAPDQPEPWMNESL